MKNGGKLTHYTEAKKLETVKLWLVTGNLTTTAAALGIPFPTVRTWRHSKWWEEWTQELKNEGRIALSNRMKSIAVKAMDVTLDRLENGDWIYDQQTGELRRKPVALRDANKVAMDHVSVAIKLEDKPQEDLSNQRVSDRLADLAEAFAAFAKKTKKVEVYDAIYEEREKKLQSGSELGEDQEAITFDGSCEESSSEEGDGEGGVGQEV